MKLLTTDEFDCNTIRRLIALYRDGNHKLRQPVEKGILLIGNIGVGKSTFAHVLAGRKLQAVMDVDTNQLIIEALTPLEGIVIEHKSSETKMLSKSHIQNVIIWEFPGFDDSDPVDETSKLFYVKRLFEITNQLKFFLLVSESDLKSRKGIEFLKTISNFIKLFKDVKDIEGCTSLVITKVSKRKSIQSIRKMIENIVACNQAVTENVRAFISEMKFSSLYLFHEPSEERRIIVPDVLECINLSGKYAVVYENKIKIDVSTEGRSLSSYFLRTVCNNITQIIEVTAEFISNVTCCFPVTEHNAFSKHHYLIEDWIPSSFQYSISQNVKIEHFLEVRLLTELKNVLSNKVFNISDAVKITQQMHDVLLKYIDPNSVLYRQIVEYEYCLQQQYEFMEYFCTICEIEPLDQGAVYQLLKNCYENTKKNLENAVINLYINENKDEEYYYQAIEILENYRQFPDCMKQLEISYRWLAEVARPKKRYSTLINIINSAIAYLIILPYRILSLPFRIMRRLF